MPLAAIVSVLAAAFVDWLVVAFSVPRLKYITKPLVLGLMILWLSLAGGWRWPLLLFTLGAVFSLAGDICLMLPGRFFLPGLFSFLTAHLFYIAGFLQDGLPTSLVYYLSALLTIVWSVFLTRRIRKGVLAATGAGRLRKAVTLYSGVVTAMFLASLSTAFKPGWFLPAFLPAAAGGFLFFLSDGLLAYDRFVTPVRSGRLLVRIAYHLGQLLLLWGAVRNFS